jgi:hypothetical protein
MSRWRLRGLLESRLPRAELGGQREGEAGIGGVGLPQIVRRVDQGNHAIRDSYLAV